MRKYCTSSDATADRFVQKDNPVSLKVVMLSHYSISLMGDNDQSDRIIGFSYITIFLCIYMS